MCVHKGHPVDREYSSQEKEQGAAKELAYDDGPRERDFSNCACIFYYLTLKTRLLSTVHFADAEPRRAMSEPRFERSLTSERPTATSERAARTDIRGSRQKAFMDRHNAKTWRKYL